MNIQLSDNIILTSDENNFMLKKINIGKKKREKVLGYFGTLEHALESYLKQLMLNSQTTTLLELLKECKNNKEFIRKLIKEE